MTSSPDRPRVALLRSNFLPYSETFIYDEIRHHERYEIDVFAHTRRNERIFPLPPDRVVTLPPLERLLHETTQRSPTYTRAFRARRYALVHGHFGQSAVHGLALARRFGLPLVATFHGKDVSVLASRMRWLPEYWLYGLRGARLLREADRLLAASTELADMLVGLGAPRARVFVHRLGIDLSAFAPRAPSAGARPPQIAMVGRLVEKKGTRYGLDAFAAVLRDARWIDGKRPHLWIVGDGRLRGAIEAQVRALGIGPHVTLTGMLPHAEVAQLLETVDVLLAPSCVAASGDRESGVIAVKEASARAIPVVGTRHGGIPEIVDDGATGFLVAERDAEALAASLRRLLDDGELRRRMGEAGRLKMEREYDIRVRVAALADHYDEVIAARRPR